MLEGLRRPKQLPLESDTEDDPMLTPLVLPSAKELWNFSGPGKSRDALARHY